MFAAELGTANPPATTAARSDTKIALMLVAAATLAASVSAPAEARGVRIARPVAAVAAATAAAIAADAYYNGGYYYHPGVVYYGGPAYGYGYPAVRYGW